METSLSAPSYRPLNDQRKEIRLLRILPGTEGERIQAHLDQAFLCDPTAYETISYCWGDATDRDVISLNGALVNVPANSAAALRCMRQIDVPRIVWIDSICINQNDLDERAQQVGMMADIYKSAWNNQIYLGEEDEHTKSAFGTFERVYDEIRRKTSDFGQFHELMRTRNRGGEHADEPLECQIDEPAIASIFGRPWFQRLWVVQEGVLARSNICYCGRNFSVGLTTLLRVAIWLCYCRDFISPWFWDFDGLHNAADLWTWIDDKDNLDNLNSESFTNLLLLARYRLSTEPRDRVFALLGLIDRKTEEEQESIPEALLLMIDYEKPCHKVMRDATRYAIQEIFNLRILQVVSHRAEDGELDLDGHPSWIAWVDVPFDPDYDAESMPPNNFSADDNVGFYAEEIKSDAAGPDTLCLPGYPISSIVEVSDVFTPSIWENKVAVADVLEKITAMVNKMNIQEIDWWAHGETPNTKFPSNLALAIMAGTNTDSQDPTSIELDEFKSLLNRLASCSFSPWEAASERLYKILRDKCQNRRFFTGSGGHIGLVPRCARPGDLTAVLLGSSVPMVLRPARNPDVDEHQGTTFQFLGDAYVNGVMKGEFVSSAREAGYDPEEFFLV
ncbi:HET-domain-containing protein [Xylariaceae sp. AK1471]|nr:HET-domain-containing protein [Xylariaceae sp. AK1471]